MKELEITDKFVNRHIGSINDDVEAMLSSLGLKNLDELIEKTIPAQIRNDKQIDNSEGMSEFEYLNYITNIAKKNKVYRSYIGLGYYSTIVPSPIRRNVLENPG